MEEPLYITDEPLKPGLDYYHLRAEGIKYIQELTGSFWTDYNEHDPGVTILEQLCFALTDLSYRTDFDIQDHFHNRNPKDFTFLKPNEIFPCNALTTNDYRKLIFDSVFELNNVWVLPLSGKRSSMNGVYKILLDVNENVKEEEARQQIVQKAREVYWDNRNICEDIEDIKILRNLPVTFHADIEIDGKRDGESILASIYYKLNEYMSPEIRFYSLEELLNLGYHVDQIFNGPLLKHGFIRTEDLQPKPSRLLISDLIKIIMQIEGVVSVKNLFLKINDRIYENQIEIGEEELPKLITNINDQQSRTVHFYRGSVQYNNLDHNLVKRKLNELTSANKRVYRLSEETITIPEGEALDLEEYFSVQNDFPLIYGIGELGIPHNPNNKRKAQAKQLKSYLLIFEQIMANYLAQLSNAKNLFSLNADLKQTYYYQSLEKSVPDVQPLLKKKGQYEPPQNGFTEYTGLESYKEGHPALVKMKDNYTDRRNRFLDYLLAIHGEAYTQYSLAQFNYYFSDVAFEKHLIQNKTRLLQALSFINKNRAKAFNYKKASLNTDNITGLEAKISLLLGLGIGDESKEENTGYKAHSIIDIYNKYKLKLVKDGATRLGRRSWEKEAIIKAKEIDEAYIEQHFDFVDTDEVDMSDFSQRATDTLLKKTLPFRANMILEVFLREGLNLEQYKIGSYGHDENTSWVVLFKLQQSDQWIQIAEYDQEKKANAAVQALIRFLTKLNIETEGLHIVEHILLRPDLDDARYGIFMLSPEGKPLLRSTKLYTFEERKEVIQELKKHIGYYENYSVEATPDKDFEIHFKTVDGTHTFVSVKAKPSVEETHQDMESLHKLMSDELVLTPYDKKIGFYIRYSDDTHLLPEDFFSFRSSILIPTWSARFNNKEFRAIAEDIISENSPANVSFQILWLNTEEMESFEQTYYAWMNEKANALPEKEKLDTLNNTIAQMLLNFKNKNAG
jgi:hypothetical protein